MPPLLLAGIVFPWLLLFPGDFIDTEFNNQWTNPWWPICKNQKFGMHVFTDKMPKATWSKFHSYSCLQIPVFSIQILHMNFHFKTPGGIFQDITNKCSDDFFCTCIMLNVFLFVFVKSVKAGRNFPSFRCLTPLLVPLMAPPPQHVYTCCFYFPYTSIIMYFIALHSVLSV